MLRFQGYVDIADRERLCGWAWYPDEPNAVVVLAISHDDELIGTVHAGQYRPDLETQGIGTGRYGFDVRIDQRLPAEACAVRVREMRQGEEITGSPARIAVRKGPVRLPELSGYLDHVDRTIVTGWAAEKGLDEPVALTVSVNGESVARLVANGARPDLAAIGPGLERCGFSFMFEKPLPLRDLVLRVRRATDGRDIGHSPFHIPAPGGFDPALCEKLLSDPNEVGDDADIRRRIGFLSGQIDRLLQIRASRLGGVVERERDRQRQLFQGHAHPQEGSPDDGRAPTSQVMPPRPLPMALVIDDRMPVLNRDAGSQAVVSHMQALRRLGYNVSFVPADMAARGEAETLEERGIGCCHAPWFGSVEEVLRRLRGQFDLVYLHRMANAHYLALIRRYQPGARLVLSLADLASLRLHRQGVVERRPELVRHARDLRAAELAAARFVDGVITHSPVEAELIGRELPAGRLHVVPWSVEPAPDVAPFDATRGIAFVGSYDHAPNLDAANHFVRTVMPLVWRGNPDIVCTLAGSNPPPALAALAGPRVTVAGHVPDLGAFLRDVRLTVAPLAFGAGIKGKVLDSLAAGVPCVCSPVAAEGFDLPPPLRRLVADTPEAMAGVILALYSDGTAHARARQAGLAYVSTRHTRAVVDEALRRAVSPGE